MGKMLQALEILKSNTKLMEFALNEGGLTLEKAERYWIKQRDCQEIKETK